MNLHSSFFVSIFSSQDSLQDYTKILILRGTSDINKSKVLMKAGIQQYV